MDRLFNTKTGKIILSVIWGLGIAAVFYKVCEHAGCFVVDSPSTPQIYELNNECFNGKCSQTQPNPEYKQNYPPKCDQSFDSEPPIDWFENRRPHNCGDARHNNPSSCYKSNPMDSIFRAPSNQIFYPYH